MADFNPAFDYVLAEEGGWQLTNHASDKGGMTFAGVSRRANPDWTGWKLIDQGASEADEDLHERVRWLYRENYWLPLRLDEVTQDGIAQDIFSCAILSGPRTASVLAQIATGAEPDGKIGPKTVFAINGMNLELWDLRFCLARIARYRKIVLHDKTQRRFFLGWVTRALGGMA